MAVVAIRVRKRLELSLSEMGRILQVPGSAISRYEHGASEPAAMVADVYHALDKYLSKGGAPGRILDHLADERGRFLYILFTLAYAPRKPGRPRKDPLG